MALTIIHAQRVALKTLLASDRKHGGGIEATRQQHDCARNFGHDA